MFVDEAEIRVQAGGGGNGCLAFRREKFVPRGGPSGGDGGDGGDIILESSQRHNTLVQFRFNPEHKAQRGGHGEGSNRHGRRGEDVVLRVPVGTVVSDAETGARVADFDEPGQRAIVAHGGRGGRGNARFASSTNQAPRRVEPGTSGEARRLKLELKLLAEVGLVGFPNAGKSTLISVLSAARPKIADYPFTTLTPNLGVVCVDDDTSFVIADVPGLIEGAHAGAGLGTRFLRHLERTRLLAHLVDVSPENGRDAVRDFEVIGRELQAFGAGLEAKPMVLVASKCDVADEEKLASLRALAGARALPLLEISSVTGAGVAALKYALAEQVQRARQAQPPDAAAS
ncbi:MAG: GTPase ObgE [Terriglobales bacterium]